MGYCKKNDRECIYFNICSNENINIKNEYKEKFSKINIEEILLKIGIKKIWKKEGLNIGQIQDNINLYKKKYVYGIYTFNDSNNIKGEKLVNKSFICILSNNNNNINNFIYYDHSNKSIERVVATGILLGYPKCCTINHFNSINNLLDAIKIDKNFDKNIYKNGVKCKLLNPYLKLYVHIPCSNICKNTINNSEKVLKYLEGIYGKEIVNYFFYTINNETRNN